MNSYTSSISSRGQLRIGYCHHLVVLGPCGQMNPSHIAHGSAAQGASKGAFPADPAAACVSLIFADKRHRPLMIILIDDRNRRPEPCPAAVWLGGRIDHLGILHPPRKPIELAIDLAQLFATID